MPEENCWASGLNKKIAEQINPAFSLFGNHTKKEWESKEIEGMRQFFAEEIWGENIAIICNS